MKKILAFTLTGLLALSGVAVAANTNVAAEAAAQTEISAKAQNNLYLIPGTYTADGQKVENTIPSGAEKLDEEQCGAIFNENAYLCTLSVGAALPVPASERVDKDGNKYSFNGWWSIVDATVTYFDKVPAISETTYLYADWRADLSQRKDPVAPADSTTVQPLHYMSIKRAKTGEVEKVVLRISGTDVTNAEKLGYDRPVQLYNGWFELNPGDEITVYAAGLGDSTEAQLAPLDVAGRTILLENSSDGKNVTGSYLNSSVTDAVLMYKKSLKTRHFRIYIKFQSAGAKMLVYMEPMD
ncbi:MAG: hypothetical protein K2N74_04910 [Clostridiales bacterium]|nr:hypothetical protein [Clostridiales bacterium]